MIFFLGKFMSPDYDNEWNPVSKWSHNPPEMPFALPQNGPISLNRHWQPLATRNYMRRYGIDTV